MSKYDDNELLEQLKKSHSEVTPKNSFKEELESTLINRFNHKSKNKLWMPMTGMAVAVVLFLLLVLTLDDTLGQPGTPVEDTEPRVLIYHTHNHESFLPALGIESEGEEAMHHAFDETINVTISGGYLKQDLIEHGIKSIHLQHDIMEELAEADLPYKESYTLSRRYLEATLDQYDDIDLVLDIHRAIEPWEKTTTSIHGENVAQIVMVIGMEHPNYTENHALAKALSEKLNDIHPDLSRGVKLLSGPPRNGIYNQDVHPHSILLEIGGYDNSLEEIQYSTKYLARAISELFETS
ncbi:stage II sporulation protein P [Bacillus alkalicellulosilyticus]|uniref:stage II sporulation protein P n=1 Tax=Alkalihalobacterium alkalicellulosilyticum TaxID=1912214 RepID=UPI001482CD78|nr:stage II sporulation protein P [Bacillus alkalicellulosilyticus]